MVDASNFKSYVGSKWRVSFVEIKVAEKNLGSVINMVKPCSKYQWQVSILEGIEQKTLRQSSY